MVSRVSGSDGTKAEVAMEILNFFLLYMIVDEGYWLESHLIPPAPLERLVICSYSSVLGRLTVYPRGIASAWGTDNVL